MSECDTDSNTTACANHSSDCFQTRCKIRDIAPSTSYLCRNVYHLHVPLFILDAVRVFQDHPKFCKGLKEEDLIELLEKEPFACGDIEAQVKMALKELTDNGFVRHLPQGYRTLGPFARLALARTPHQFSKAWDKLTELQKVSSTNLLVSSSSSRSQTC